MVWKHLKQVMEDYTTYIHYAVLQKLPTKYAIRDSIKITVDITDRGWYEVEFNAPDYWIYIEEGRKAGKMPPSNAIEQWIVKRNIVPQPLKNGKLPTTAQLAYVIARKIGKKGIKATHFLSSSIEEAEIEFKERIANAMGQDISEEIHSFLEPSFGNVKTINL